MVYQLGEKQPERFDLFISHASEDKEKVVRPLVEILMRRGLAVWLDELELTIGDSLSRRIEAGLAHSRFGVVVISPAFAPKEWPQRELAGLNAREVTARTKIILPVWHEVDQQFVTEWFPILADRLGAKTSAGLDKVADQIVLAMERSHQPSFSPPQAESSALIEQSRSRSRLRSRLPRLGGLGILSALIAFVLFASMPQGPRADSPESLPNSVLTPELELSLPASWRRSSLTSPTPGMKLFNSLTLRSQVTGGALVVGSVSSSSPTLLPASLIEALPASPHGEAVVLGEVSLYRYPHLEVDQSVGQETVYALPSAAGVILGVCFLGNASPVKVSDDCDRIVESINLLTTNQLDLGPQPSYATGLARALSQLNRARVKQGHGLIDAKSPTAQASSARQLANAYRLAAASLGTASPGPGEQAIGSSVVKNLDDIASDYSRMAEAVHDQSSSRFNRARAKIAIEIDRARREIERLREFGYRIT